MGLGVGDRCPTIDGLSYLKGTGSGSLPCPGQTTVIECWATWCGPCRQMFPHLTDLQRRNKARGLLVCGVTSEQNSAKLKQFVEEQGYAMDYTVAVDENQDMESTLMGPAGVRGIPHAFVVDTAGIIRYSGHPADPQFNTAVEQCLVAAVPAKVPLPLITASAEELAALPMKEIKRILTERNISTKDIFEKAEFVQRIVDKASKTTYFADAPAGSSEPMKSTPATAFPPTPTPAPHHGGCCGGGGCSSSSSAPAAAAPPPPPLPQDVAGMSIGALKAALTARGLSLAGCAEKADLVARLNEVAAKEAAAWLESGEW